MQIISHFTFSDHVSSCFKLYRHICFVVKMLLISKCYLLENKIIDGDCEIVFSQLNILQLLLTECHGVD